MSAKSGSKSSFIDIARGTGIDIKKEDGAVLWTGFKGGNIKPVSPL
jgi:hypothetical protein